MEEWVPPVLVDRLLSSRKVLPSPAFRLPTLGFAICRWHHCLLKSPHARSSTAAPGEGSNSGSLAAVGYPVSSVNLTVNLPSFLDFLDFDTYRSVIFRMSSVWFCLMLPRDSIQITRVWQEQRRSDAMLGSAYQQACSAALFHERESVH